MAHYPNAHPPNAHRSDAQRSKAQHPFDHHPNADHLAIELLHEVETALEVEKDVVFEVRSHWEDSVTGAQEGVDVVVGIAMVLMGRAGTKLVGEVAC